MLNRSLQLSFFLPESNWRAPNGFPLHLLSSNEPIAIDTENEDPLLKEKGPSWRYGQGQITGIALATQHEQWYYPFAHLGGDNLPRTAVLMFFRDLLSSSRDVYLANAAYDIGWIDYYDLLPKDPKKWPRFHDALLNEALLCEEHPMGYSLDAVGKRRLNVTKNEELLSQAAKDLGLDKKKDLWKFPARYVGPYAEQDARLTFDLVVDQMKEIEEQQIERVWEVETQLIPIVHLMTKRGIPMDTARADQLNHELLQQEKEIKLPFDPWANEQVTSVLRSEGHDLPKTEAGNYSADKKVLNSCALWTKEGHPANTAAKIVQFRQLNRLRKTYVEEATNWIYKGKVYPSYLQVAGEEGGAKPGRFAAKKINIMQIPKRSAIGSKIRGLYHPGEYGSHWGKFDFSSQEPRWQVHFALKSGFKSAEKIRDSFIAGKKLYSWITENIEGISYDDSKMLVLARSYGMQAKSFAELIGESRDKAKELLERFDKKVPYLSQMSDKAQEVAQRRGYLRTILNRKQRFLYWEPKDYDSRKTNTPVFGYHAAKKRWPNEPLMRAKGYTALNRLIQGSSADQVKQGMVNIWDNLGIFPFCPVHDELDFPINGPEDPLIHEICRHMEDAIPGTLCPFKVDCDIGETWQ